MNLEDVPLYTTSLMEDGRELIVISTHPHTILLEDSSPLTTTQETLTTAQLLAKYPAGEWGRLIDHKLCSENTIIAILCRKEPPYAPPTMQ